MLYPDGHTVRTEKQLLEYTEVFAHVLMSCAKAFELNPNCIKFARKQECIQARCACVYFINRIEGIPFKFISMFAFPPKNRKCLIMYCHRHEELMYKEDMDYILKYNEMIKIYKHVHTK